MQHKDFRIEIKKVEEDGTFEGILSVYDVVDLGGDLIEAGAFTKTLQENGPDFPMLWQHDTAQPIGILTVKDTGSELSVKGAFLMTVQRAKEAYDLVKAKVIKGLSIGYRPIPGKVKMVKGVRHLSELQLFEGSVVTFPMLPLAQITAVKKEGEKADFLTELETAQTYAMRFMMMEAFMDSLNSIAWDSNLDPESKLALSKESGDQFMAAYLEFLPKILRLWGEMANRKPDAKVGRTHSAATLTQINEAIGMLQALLQPGTESTEESTASAALPVTKAADDLEPDALHSMVNDFTKAVQSALAAP